MDRTDQDSGLKVFRRSLLKITAQVPPWLNLTVLGLLLVLSAIYIFRKSGNAKVRFEGTQRVTPAPVWRPFIGHIVDFIVDPNAFLRGIRNTAKSGVFTINLLGNQLTMIFSPSLVSSVFSQRSTVIDFEEIVWQIIVRVGGASSRYKEKWLGSFHDLSVVTIAHMMREPGLSTMITTYMSGFRDELPHLVSFLPSRVDHSPWEREAQAVLVTDEGVEKPVMEANLLALILHFMGTASQPSLVGRDFIAQNPNFLHDLFTFNHAFSILAAGLPSWLPIPMLRRAVAARNRMMDAVAVWSEAVRADATGAEMPKGYDDVSDVAKVMRERILIEMKHGLPAREAAIADFSVIWALHANANFVTFWMLMRLFCDENLLNRVREETDPFVKIEPRPKDGLSQLEAPRVDIDHIGLSTRAPLLKSCFIESLRLDSSPWSVRRVLSDFRLTENSSDATSFGAASPRAWSLNAGDFITVPFDVHFTDPKHFPDPTKFIPERHIRPGENGNGPGSAEWGTVRAFGGGASMCKGRLFAEREVLASVAGLLKLWNFEPADGAFKLPKAGKATAVNMPQQEVRVRISRREESWK